MDRRLFQIVLVRAHAEGAAGYRDHVVELGGGTFNRRNDIHRDITLYRGNVRNAVPAAFRQGVMDCVPTPAHHGALDLLTYGTGVVYMRRGAADLQRRIALLGATTAARPTGCLTTTPVATTARPGVATQPARYTP
jgi:hypothetical protein